jgi:purine-binding chemotaxis protein CheW
MSDDSRYLVFQLEKEDYAVPLLKVKEVIAVNDITPLPETPPHFKGIMNLRGKIISVIDLRVKFKKQAKDVAQETSIIILDVDPLSLGIIVDSIDSVLAVEPEEVQTRPDVDPKGRAEYLAGIVRKDKRLILLLDIDKTLSVTDLVAIKAAQTSKTATAA